MHALPVQGFMFQESDQKFLVICGSQRSQLSENDHNEGNVGGGREGAWATFRQTLDRALGSTLMGEDTMDARGARKSDRQHPGPADVRP